MGTAEDELIITGLGPLPLLNDDQWAMFSADMFGRYSVLLDKDDLGASHVSLNADMMIAVAIWRHMTYTKIGEPTLHDVAIGKWPAEASSDELANPFVNASVFEMYWCVMHSKIAGGDCTADGQDLYRDLYIWNAMILNVPYETNGVDSQWYWFGNNQEGWTYDPEADLANSEVLMYTGM